MLHDDLIRSKHLALYKNSRSYFCKKYVYIIVISFVVALSSAHKYIAINK